MTSRRSGKGVCAVFLTCALMCAAATISASAQTFTSLGSFDQALGYGPQGALIQRADGSFYGTAQQGTFRKNGSVFQVTTAGTLTLAHYFCSRTGCADGSFPEAGLFAGSTGDYYGTTALGGANNDGTVFEITEGGTLFTLHSFAGADGANASSGVIEGTDGNFYGTTSGGGTGVGFGTVFKMTPDGTVTMLHAFTGGDDGNAPRGGLVQGTDGNFYGTTSSGGHDCGACGTVFKITPSGTLTTLYEFCSQGGAACTDGTGPNAGLVQGTDGNFYGTTLTFGGGTFPPCNTGCGTIFKITPSGVLTTLHTFTGSGADGGNPQAALIQATDGNFYGTASNGGTVACSGAGCGAVFEITPSGTFTTLHNFSGADGRNPFAALVQGTDGNFYGTTFEGGANSCSGLEGCGTVFKISTGLGPFVIPVPTSGKIGRKITILGTDLTGATSVTFNGIAAAFTVVSTTEISTAVPADATTGTVQVVTPSGTLSGNVVFRVP